MQTINLYKHTRKDGGVTISRSMPEGEYTPMYRLIADEGKMLKKDDIETPCVDVESTEGWEEFEIPVVEEPEVDVEISDTEALKIIMGGAEG